MVGSVRSDYERAFGELVGVPRVRTFGLGRQALFVLLKALGLCAGDRVGVCAFSCESVTEAVKLTGATPVYLDVDEHLCIDPAMILREQPGSLKVVILQHTFGIPGRLSELLDACRQVDAKVVEDCCHVLVGTWNGVPLGTFGEGAFYSQGAGKPWPLGHGGTLTVNSDSLMQEVDVQIAQWALPESTRTELVVACKRRIYDASVFLGVQDFLKTIDAQLRRRRGQDRPSETVSDFRPYRGYVRISGDIHCRAGLKRLDDWPRLKATRIRNTVLIEELFSRAGLPLWPVPSEADPVMLSYPVRMSDKPGALELARRTKVNLFGYWRTPVDPLWGDALAKVGYRLGSCPHAERATEQIVHISTTATTVLQSANLLIRLSRMKGLLGSLQA